MHRYDARQILLRIYRDIETDERLARLCALVSSYHDPLS